MNYSLFIIAFLLVTNTFAKELDLIAMTAKYEGFKSQPYIDANGMSIGYGTHLPLTKYEAKLLMIHRLSIVNEQLKQYVWFHKLNYNRKVVIIEIVYQLGLTKFLKFNNTIWCLKHKYYHAVANHLKDSLWYKQSGERSKELVKLFYEN